MNKQYNLHVKDYWYNVWKRALTNVPERYREWTESYWRQLPHGTMSVEQFRAGVVAGKYKLEHDNHVYEFVTEHKSMTYGRFSSLGRCLGLPVRVLKPRTDNKRRHHNIHNRVYQNYVRGSKPRDEKVANLLIQLAGPNGRELAWNILGQQNIAHRYHFDPARD